MSKERINTTSLPENIEWLTIDETVDFINKKCNLTLSNSHIYRLALSRELILSIYFQSPIILKKIVYKNQFILKKIIEHHNFLYKLCFQNPINFKFEKKKHYNAIALTEGEYIFPNNFIWDTELTGIESVAIQKALAQSLCLPEPIIGQYHYHCGLLINDRENTYQVFERSMVKNRIQSQLDRIAPSEQSIIRTAKRIIKCSSPMLKQILNSRMLFPAYQLPCDAFFVLKRNYVEAFVNKYNTGKLIDKSSNRMSTPLSRFLWLACKNNPLIGAELLTHPYKLLSLFEVWAKEDGISDKLSGDTLKKALSRGSPVI